MLQGYKNLSLLVVQQITMFSHRDLLRIFRRQSLMKQGIHPKYVASTVVCACGNSTQTLSIKPVLKVDVCSKCHPFFTGQQRMLDTAGMVERFRKRFNLQEEVEV